MLRGSIDSDASNVSTMQVREHKKGKKTSKLSDAISDGGEKWP